MQNIRTRLKNQLRYHRTVWRMENALWHLRNAKSWLKRSNRLWERDAALVSAEMLLTNLVLDINEELARAMDDRIIVKRVAGWVAALASAALIYFTF